MNEIKEKFYNFAFDPAQPNANWIPLHVDHYKLHFFIIIYRSSQGRQHVTILLCTRARAIFFFYFLSSSRLERSKALNRKRNTFLSIATESENIYFIGRSWFYAPCDTYEEKRNTTFIYPLKDLLFFFRKEKRERIVNHFI